jgi:hypothetical protein
VRKHKHARQCWGSDNDTADLGVRAASGQKTYREEVSEDRYEKTYLTSVYFALDTEAAQIKIGISTNVERRLYELSNIRGRNLDLLGTMKGGKALEQTMHHRFRPYLREGREWFSSEIIADVAQLLAA